MATLTHHQAGRIYDHIGRLLDTQGFYEEPACRRLVEMGRFDQAHSVFELGCGTGRLAERLLAQMDEGAAYHGVDVSTGMVNLSRRRLSRFGARAVVDRCDGSAPLAVRRGAFDRFVSTYVFDLLSQSDIAAMIDEASRLLVGGGLLCCASLHVADAGLAGVVSSVLTRLHRIAPLLTGGCRPVAVGPFLAEAQWDEVYAGEVVAFGVPSEVIVARRR